MSAQPGIDAHRAGRWLAEHVDRFLTSAEPGAASSRVVLAEAARDALRAADL
jgi:hypothetical protein